MSERHKTGLDALPKITPLFPLRDVLLLPRGRLPLHVFEPRYITMVEDALSSHRVISIIQPKEEDEDGSCPIFEVGCAGKITDFDEMKNGRYLVTLTGLCRFHVEKELPLHNGYRRIRPDWSSFEDDLETPGCLNLDRDRLRPLLQEYFNIHEMACEWEIVNDAADERLITALSMICPFGAREKQALLESCCRCRADMFMTLLEMAVRGNGNYSAPLSSGCH